MVEVMKIMVTSFKRSYVPIAALSAPNPAAGHHQPTLLPKTSGHSWASLGQSLVGSLLLSSGSRWAQGFVCALQESVSPVLCKFWQLYGGVNGDLLQDMPYPGLLHPEPLALQQSTVPLQETLKHSSTSVSVGSLGPGAHKVSLSPLSVSGGYRV